MNYHQSLKSEVEARSRSTLECIEMGKTLLAARNPAAEEVRPVKLQLNINNLREKLGQCNSSSSFNESFLEN